MTVMEMAHSRTWPQIAECVNIMEPIIPEITSYTYSHRTRLVRPMLSYDSAAIALSFLPAAGEGLLQDTSDVDNSYTYHHLRRDIYDLCQSTGVEVASRYVVPSSHMTIGRFVNQDIFNEGKVGRLVSEIEKINVELEERCWPCEDREGRSGKPWEWIVGEEKGLVCRTGTVWYGGGESYREGKGFSIP